MCSETITPKHGTFMFKLADALEEARLRYFTGDLLALADAILLCDDAGIKFRSRPSWVRENSVRVRRPMLQQPDKLRNTGTGRHTDPYIWLYEHRIHLWAYHAVVDATQSGSTGEGKWSHAEKILRAKKGISKSPSTIKRSYYLIKKKYSDETGNVSKSYLPRHPLLTQAYRRRYA